MVKCSACGRSIEKVPDWMQSITAEFICNNCPNRQSKNITFAQLQTPAPVAAKAAEAVQEIDVEEVSEEEVEA